MAPQRVPQARDTRPGPPASRPLLVEPLETRTLMAVLWGDWNGPRAEHADRATRRDADRTPAFDSRITTWSHRNEAAGDSRLDVQTNHGYRDPSNHGSAARRSSGPIARDRQTLVSNRSSIAPTQRTASLTLLPTTTLISLRPVSRGTLITTNAPRQISLIAIPISTVSSTVPTTGSSVQLARISTTPALQTSRSLQAPSTTVGFSSSNNAFQPRSSASLLVSGSSSIQRTAAPVTSIQIAIRPVSIVASVGSSGTRSHAVAANPAASHLDWLSSAASGVGWIGGTDDGPLADPSHEDGPAAADTTANQAQPTSSNQIGGMVAWSTAPDFGKPWRRRNGNISSEVLAGDASSVGTDSSATDRSDISYLGLIELPFTDRVGAQRADSQDAESRDAESKPAESESNTRRVLGDLELSIDPADVGRDYRDDFAAHEDSADRSWGAITDANVTGENDAVESSDRAELTDAAFVPSLEHDQWGGLVAIGVESGMQRGNGHRHGVSGHDRADVASIGANGSVGYGWSEVVVELDSIMSSAQSFRLVDVESQPSLVENATSADPSVEAASFASPAAFSASASHSGDTSHLPTSSSPTQPAPRTE